MRRILVLAVLLLGGACTAVGGALAIASFNIQFLGHFRNRDHAALASILSACVVVAIQELVAPPYPMAFPDGAPARPDREAQAFFDAMAAHGFAHWLSEEDTGPQAANHTNTTATEWWVAFYKPGSVVPATDLPWGFLAEDRSANPDYERVPYAFAFRSIDERLDFVLISVHLAPASSRRRSEELAAIAAWIDTRDTCEKDFLVLGDMNIESAQELATALPAGCVSLNAECRPTNTAATGRPHDHVLYRPQFSAEVRGDFAVVDLVAAMRPYWTSPVPYPGDPYDHNAFRVVYSDHSPIVFTLSTDGPDDDWAGRAIRSARCDARAAPRSGELQRRLASAAHDG